jgi:hypothetical protein
MVKKLFVCFAIVGGLIFPGQVIADYGDMDPATCDPSGVKNKLREKLNPKKFWVEMVINSENAIEMHTRGDPLFDSPITVDDCKIFYKRNPTEAQRCEWKIQNLINYWEKCNRHANRMCRLHGGLCK